MNYTISDPSMHVKVNELADHIASWTSVLGDLDGKRILDFGCGGGFTAFGMATRFPNATVIGIDVNSESDQLLQNLQKYSSLTELPPNLKFYTIRPGEKIPDRPYDMMFSWSVFEHVHLSILDSILQDMNDALNSDGGLFVQIAPLFFSPEGSHLWEIGLTHWQHLEWQLSDLEGAIRHSPRISRERSQQLWSMFSTLNRITPKHLLSRVTASGFKLVREQQNKTDAKIPDALSEVYAEDVLRTFQIVALFRKMNSADASGT
ncbi:class I SAM-dependent methyltransferase [Falsiroseomonas selenitidurans]|uniref:Class I SAM-dependent methyltransferase n=1 Tax=Falsiroseomonas selenitidurans TaxID=2716335 RepID=A0ABX1E0B5_9PROT|nr:class I SAM-dependent methyltransferase [Falsiroseomonas selenitidurans]NKC30589.1 class I SAM-dependent methyltransferase [Falsiroseomonas selenitidurans]